MLFLPLQIGTMTLQNRIIRSATSEGGSDENGVPGKFITELYRRLAEGGTPLIVTGYAYIRADGRSSPLQNGIHEDKLIPHWREITAAVHRTNPDTKIAMQIVHGGRQCKLESLRETVAPSAVINPSTGITPRELTDKEIRELIISFGKAALRVKKAGFDAVQLHAAHGYLIAQFNSPFTNRRTDKWGGSLHNRMRFLMEVYQSVRQNVGDDFPVMVKLNSTDCIEGGLTAEESAVIARQLARAGIDAIELSGWIIDASTDLAPSRQFDPSLENEGYFVEAAAAVRKQVPTNIPVGLCGGIRSLEAMQRLMQQHGFDFFAMSRPFIAEPDLIKRLQKGQPRVACDSCNDCLINRMRCLPAETGELYQRIGHPEWKLIS